ncbi:DUF2147 domain-containing protein [Antarcticibacterium sp. 1MA-6-2]|uniref:DUF2147 domain-containing protein n=1 Tax=Antarcticibacterium sp. 1MA-6-2 TaxID=2908210 RepID=UPI001F2E62A4|nr:DUF2147 domain-containing protein [Antarcticibacterium sp. 1MA-6-2]UJH92146.1 DUF2147 domain-containing protein [Antarcticibacterium sp. 1MA-6-2]
MNFITIILFLFLNNTPDALIGIWLYKEDTSRIEIYKKDGKICGKLISSKNPEFNAGTEILKDFILIEGKWQGKYFLIKKDQWINAMIYQKKNILHFELNYGFINKKFHWYKEAKN